VERRLANLASCEGPGHHEWENILDRGDDIESTGKRKVILFKGESMGKDHLVSSLVFSFRKKKHLDDDPENDDRRGGCPGLGSG